MEENNKQFDNIDYDKVKGTLKSKKGGYCYLMFEKILLVINENKEIVARFGIPKNIEKPICFYDIYYSLNKVNVIIATRGSYDARIVIDEDNWEIVEQGISK